MRWFPTGRPTTASASAAAAAHGAATDRSRTMTCAAMKMTKIEGEEEERALNVWQAASQRARVPKKSTRTTRMRRAPATQQL